MTDRFVETAGLIIGVETGDPTLSSHSNRKIYYIPPNSDGTKGPIENAVSVNASAVAGENGNSQAESTAIILTAGVLVFWAESTNPGGVPCASPAFEVLVEKRGTVRR